MEREAISFDDFQRLIAVTRSFVNENFSPQNKLIGIEIVEVNVFAVPCPFFALRTLNRNIQFNKFACKIFTLLEIVIVRR